MREKSGQQVIEAARLMEPAPPVLGSVLLRASENFDSKRPDSASCGSAAIDERVLTGGFRYGEVTALSGADGVGKRLFTYHAIASHLLSNDSHEAAYIDTDGLFAPLQLREVLIFRLKAKAERDGHAHDGYMYHGQKTAQSEIGMGQDLSVKATELLNRVRVMRTFDMTGLMETLAELREAASPQSAQGDSRRTEIVDSDEDPEDAIADSNIEKSNQPGPENQSSIESATRVDMAIVSSISKVISSAVSKNSVQGHAMMASFMRTLGHLTSHHNMCTIVVNTVVGGEQQMSHTSRHRRLDEGASVFASSFAKPALGLPFTNMIDTSLLFSRLPKSKSDAMTAYGSSKAGRAWQTAVVIEVLKDKYGSREGRWAAFDIAASVKLVACFA